MTEKTIVAFAISREMKTALERCAEIERDYPLRANMSAVLRSALRDRLVRAGIWDNTARPDGSVIYEADRVQCEPGFVWKF